MSNEMRREIFIVANSVGAGRVSAVIEGAKYTFRTTEINAVSESGYKNSLSATVDTLRLINEKGLSKVKIHVVDGLNRAIARLNRVINDYKQEYGIFSYKDEKDAEAIFKLYVDGKQEPMSEEEKVMWAGFTEELFKARASELQVGFGPIKSRKQIEEDMIVLKKEKKKTSTSMNIAIAVKATKTAWDLLPEIDFEEVDDIEGLDDDMAI